MSYFAPHHFSADPPKAAQMPPTPIIFEPAPPLRWEYHVVSIDPREDEPLDETALGALGGEGWLLAGILQHPTGDSHARILYYFVRSAQ